MEDMIGTTTKHIAWQLLGPISLLFLYPQFVCSTDYPVSLWIFPFFYGNIPSTITLCNSVGKVQMSETDEWKTPG
jgi:hypothetical protein